MYLTYVYFLASFLAIIPYLFFLCATCCTQLGVSLQMRAMPSRAASRSPNGEALNGSLPMDRAWYYLTFEERAAMVGALGGVTFGYDIGVIAGALVSLSEDFSLDANTEGAGGGGMHEFALSRCGQ